MEETYNISEPGKKLIEKLYPESSSEQEITHAITGILLSSDEILQLLRIHCKGLNKTSDIRNIGVDIRRFLLGVFGRTHPNELTKVETIEITEMYNLLKKASFDEYLIESIKDKVKEFDKSM